VIGNKSAPFMNQLVANGALMTQSYAGDASEASRIISRCFPVAPFGLTSDALPGQRRRRTESRRPKLLAAGHTFAGFSEDLPAVGFAGYARRVSTRESTVPWANFTNCAA